MKKIAFLTLTLLASSVSWAQTVATVNGQPIDSSRVDSLLEQCKPLALIGDRSCADDADFSSSWAGFFCTSRCAKKPKSWA